MHGTFKRRPCAANMARRASSRPTAALAPAATRGGKKPESRFSNSAERCSAGESARISARACRSCGIIVFSIPMPMPMPSAGTVAGTRTMHSLQPMPLKLNKNSAGAMASLGAGRKAKVMLTATRVECRTPLVIVELLGRRRFQQMG